MYVYIQAFFSSVSLSDSSKSNTTRDKSLRVLPPHSKRLKSVDLLLKSLGQPITSHI